jgi:hypothetical protein
MTRAPDQRRRLLGTAGTHRVEAMLWQLDFYGDELKDVGQELVTDALTDFVVHRLITIAASTRSSW